VEKLRWSRIPVGAAVGQERPHPHSFIRDGEDKRIAAVEVCSPLFFFPTDIRLRLRATRCACLRVFFFSLSASTMGHWLLGGLDLMDAIVKAVEPFVLPRCQVFIMGVPGLDPDSKGGPSFLHIYKSCPSLLPPTFFPSAIVLGLMRMRMLCCR